MDITRLTQHINAPRALVCKTLLGGAARPKWKVPDGITAMVQAFAPRVGGAIHVSLAYNAPDAQGKSSEHTDTFRGRFTVREPNAILLVGDLLHPLHGFAAERFLNRDVCHRGRGRRTVPMFLARFKPHDIAGAHVYHRPAFTLRETESRCDD